MAQSMILQEIELDESGFVEIVYRVKVLSATLTLFLYYLVSG